MKSSRISKKSQLETSTKQELLDNAIFYRHLLELTPEAIVIHSEGKIIYINPTALNMIGAKNAKEIVGKSVMDFIHPDSVPLIKKRIQMMLSKQKVAPFVEEKFISLQGEIFLAETKAVPFIYEGKQAILAILRDITTKKKEEERKQFLDNLSKELGSSIDYRTTLQNISKNIVPFLADYSRIVLTDDAKEIKEVFAYHINPSKLKFVEKLYEEYKSQTAPYGVIQIITTGKSEIMQNVTLQSAKMLKNSEPVKNIMSELGVTSYMGIPLKISNRVIGAITFSSISNDRIYTKEDLHFVEEVARRISYAIDHARSYSHAQKALEAQERLSAIVAFSDDAIISKTLDGIITSWNKSAERMFGYKTEEAIGKPITITIPKELWDEEKEIIRRIKKGLHIDHYETTRIRKDGQRISVSVSISSIKNSKGKVVAASNITRDITEKKKIENDLAHLASLVESSSDAIWSRTLDNKILSWNKGAEQMYGYTAKEVVGKSIADFILTEDKLDELEKITQSVLKGEEIQALESTRITKDKRIIDVSMTISPLKDPEGNIIGISAIVRNITAQKEQAKLKDEFISMASHELKTPITSMKMFLDILHNYLSKESNDKALSYVNRIKDQANKIRDLVNDLLDVSRIETGKMRFNNELFQLEEILFDTIEGIQPAVRKHHLEFHHKNRLSIYGDRFRIYQVITNLLNNAVKYSPKKDRIVITAKKEGNKAIVSVQDFGIGIPKDKQEKIFEKLYQVTDPDVKTFPGLGMGLYISNEIVKRHNGSMWVESTKGKGSTFYFTLPLHKQKNNSKIAAEEIAEVRRRL